MAVFNVWSGPASVHFVGSVHTKQEARAIECNQRRSFELVLRRFDEQIDLLGRLAAPASHLVQAGVPKIGRVDLADSVIAQTRTGFNSAGPGLMMNHSKCQFELLFFACIAVVGEPHIFPFMLVLDQIWCYKSL